MKKCLISFNRSSWDSDFLLIPEKLLGELMQCPIYTLTYVPRGDSQYILQANNTITVKILDESLLQTEVIPVPEEEVLAEAA